MNITRRLTATALLFTLVGIGAQAIPAGSAPAHAAESPAGLREIEIVVDGAYKPDRITIAKGERVRLKFVRKDYGACTRELLIPKLDVKRELAPGKPVTVDLPDLEPGEYEFRCGMNMLKGTIVVSG